MGKQNLCNNSLLLTNLFLSLPPGSTVFKSAEMLSVTSKIPLDTSQGLQSWLLLPFPSMCLTFPTTFLKPVFISASINSNTTHAPITQQDETYSSAICTRHGLGHIRAGKSLQRQPSKEKNIQVSSLAVVLQHLDPLLSWLNKTLRRADSQPEQKNCTTREKTNQFFTPVRILTKLHRSPLSTADFQHHRASTCPK